MQNRLRKLKEEQDVLVKNLSEAVEKSKKTAENKKAVEDNFVRFKEMETNENKRYKYV